MSAETEKDDNLASLLRLFQNAKRRKKSSEERCGVKPKFDRGPKSFRTFRVEARRGRRRCPLSDSLAKNWKNMGAN